MSESKWLKCDLHTHSQYSKPVDGSRVKKMSAKEFVDTLSDKGVELFSITDHNTFNANYYSKIRKYIRENNLGIRIIDGAELNIYVENGEYFHAGFYFESIDGEEADKSLEDAISQIYDSDNAKPQLSDIIDKLSALKRKIIIIPEGDKARGIGRRKFLEQLNPDEIEWSHSFSMYKVFSAFDMSSGFDLKAQNIWAKNFYEHTSALQNLEISDEEWETISNEIFSKIKDPSLQFNNEKSRELYEVICDYGKYFTYFSFSDWHNAEPYEPEINNFIYGNLDRCFDSLEIAVYDPDSRVVRTREQTVDIPSNILRSVSFEMNGGSTKVEFSPGMNAIVGKRGSGKTLLTLVIQKLRDEADRKIEDYKDTFRITNISGEYWDGSSIKEGALASVSILEQERIKSIFQNPKESEKKIDEKFPPIDDYPMGPINKIIDVLEKIEPLKKNYKNIKPFLCRDGDEKRVLVISAYHPTHSSYEFKIELEEARQRLTKLSSRLEEFHLMNLTIKRAIEELMVEFTIAKSLLDWRDKFINEVVAIVKERSKKLSSKQAEIARKKEEKANILSAIGRMFDIKFNIRELGILADNPDFKLPPPNIRREGDYLFVTSYLNDSNATDDIWEKIEEPIKKQRSHAGRIDLINEYADGKVELKSGKENLWKDLKSFYSGKNTEPIKKFYKVKDNSTKETELTSNAEIEKEVKSGKLQDLSKASPGTKAVAYLDMLFALDDSILLFDQPEDNIDNDYIADHLVNIIRANKKKRQLIFVTHNPTIAVYGDAFNYIHATNDGNEIHYDNYYIESQEDKEKIIKILDGGRKSFSNRNKKYGNILGEEEYERTAN